jgi:ribosome-binding factor A
MSQKELKIKELLRELAAEFFSRESNRQSLITVTDVSLEARGSRARILVTVLPESEEEKAVEFIHRQLSDFKEFVKDRARLMRIPFFDVAIDKGEKNRQRLDELSKSS